MGAPNQHPSAWRRWRHSRPFWGGLFVTLGGAWSLFVMKAPLPVVLHIGMQGLAGILIPIVVLVCGILLLINPEQRLFYSIVAAVLSVASWATSNLGGFVFGMLFGLIGSALAFAWSPALPAKGAVGPDKPRHADPQQVEEAEEALPADADDAEGRHSEQSTRHGRHADVGLDITEPSTGSA